ncbi:unnamed protein product [Lampetra fluviatilis]
MTLQVSTRSMPRMEVRNRIADEQCGHGRRSRSGDIVLCNSTRQGVESQARRGDGSNNASLTPCRNGRDSSCPTLSLVGVAP